MSKGHFGPQARDDIAGQQHKKIFLQILPNRTTVHTNVGGQPSCANHFLKQGGAEIFFGTSPPRFLISPPNFLRVEGLMPAPQIFPGKVCHKMTNSPPSMLLQTAKKVRFLPFLDLTTGGAGGGWRPRDKKNHCLKCDVTFS